MANPRFLFDEHVDHDLAEALVLHEPGINIVCVGDPGAPPKKTSDPDLLIAAEGMARVLVTEDRSTMPGHLADHFQAGRHTCGVILMRTGFPLGRYLRELMLIWFATTADEWLDRADYIPY